ncbi:ABC transporter permease [Thermomonas aquatica]|uniref:Transport permease protein n=1 Tax=Thermomonas aquatica TaxID=2202149 RepID=A0A5B7ZTD7_9GAMM|nr:ABC transporter permease [Thermomonas aquatica]QDA58067.1 ABC transporter permease [Thermomonas aquatica]
MKLQRLVAVMLKEIRQMARDRMTIAMMIGIPTLQLLLFGYAINPDVRNLPAAVADMADTGGSRALVQDLFATGVVRPAAGARTPQELQALLREGKIKIGVLIPPDFERRRIDRREAVQVIVDGSDTSVQATARQLAMLPLDGGNALPASQISVLPLYNPQRISAINVVPGLIGVILTMTMVMFTAMAIVRERERGNLELLITTPVSSGELMVGKVLPYIAVGLVQVSVVLLLGAWLFAVPIRGSLAGVYGAAMLLIVANLTLGLLVSTVAKTQFQSMQMAFFLFLPSILLSGFMFPFDGMPKAAQWIAELLPLTHFMRLIRGVVLRGAQLTELWPDVLALAAFTCAMMALAILRFRKRLD